MNNTKTNTPRLETERLILRRFEPGDVDAILEIYLQVFTVIRL